MAFFLGERSLRELDGVHANLVAVVKGAIEITTQDFTVHDGLRSADEQVEHFLNETSKLNGRPHGVAFTYKGESYVGNGVSKHQTGEAVDLVPYANGKPTWDWELIFPVAEAVRAAAEGLGVRLRWGGTWKELTGTTEPARDLHARHQGWDGPHYELLS